MKHDLRISIRREPFAKGSVVRCRTLTLRERFLDRLLGKQCKVTVIVPGDSVECVSIREVPEEGDPAE